MPLAEDVNLQRFSEITHGYTGADLEALSREAAMKALRRYLPQINLEEKRIPHEVLDQMVVNNQDVLDAFREITPTAMREVYIESPNIPWDEVGGLEEVKQNLKEAVSTAKGFAENPQDWLVFMGEHGCGKTHLAAAIANGCVDGGRAVVFKEVPELLDHLRATYRPGSTATYDQLFQLVKTADVLILDDLGTESATEWAREKLYQILNYRYAAKLPTVITMRNTIEQTEPRLASRMLDVSLCTICAILAPGYHSDQLSKSPRRKRRKS